MKMKPVATRIVFFAGALVGGVPAVHAQTGADESWQFELSPYLWLAGTDGTTRVGSISSESSADFTDLINKVDLGAMGAFEARKGRWSVLFDGMYSRISDSSDDVNVKITQQIYALAGAWRAIDGAASVDLLGGMRYNYLKPTIETATARASEKLEALDPLIGIRATLRLSPRWSLVGHADVGTFKGSDYSWQALIGAQYLISDTLTMKFGYRHYKIKYSKDDFEFDNAMHGIYLGAGYRF